MLIVPHIVIQPPSLVISGSECIVLVHRRSPRSTESGHEGTELPKLYKDCDSKYGSCLLCSVDVKQLKKIHANGSGYFSNVVNYVIEGLNE